MENKNTSRVVIGVLVVLVLLLGGYIAVSGAARGGKSAATANGASEAALPMENYQARSDVEEKILEQNHTPIHSRYLFSQHTMRTARRMQ